MLILTGKSWSKIEETGTMRERESRRHWIWKDGEDSGITVSIDRFCMTRVETYWLWYSVGKIYIVELVYLCIVLLCNSIKLLCDKMTIVWSILWYIVYYYKPCTIASQRNLGIPKIGINSMCLVSLYFCEAEDCLRMLYWSGGMLVQIFSSPVIRVNRYMLVAFVAFHN